MKTIQAKNLEEAYKKAGEAFGCEVIDLDIKVIQYPSSGILGFLSKDAILEVKRTEQEPLSTEINQVSPSVVSDQNQEEVQESKATKPYKSHENIKPFNEIPLGDLQINEHPSKRTMVLDDEQKNILADIRQVLEEMFDNTLFDVQIKEVDFFDPKTVFVLIEGPDSGLLIGEKGHRYKALSYMIYTWISFKYSLALRLEIAEFLKNQETEMYRYLDAVKEEVKEHGFAQTKPLEGILMRIAFKDLKKHFKAKKFISIKTDENEQKYICIDDFKKHEELL